MRNETARREIESLDYYLQNHTNDYSEESHTAMMMAVDALSSKWIPVSERLPEENKTVIVSTEYGVYPEARYTKEYGWEWAYEAGADYWKELAGVTAWIPLPTPYEPQESEE